MPPKITRLILETLLALVEERLDEYPDDKPQNLKSVKVRLQNAIELPPQELHLP